MSSREKMALFFLFCLTTRILVVYQNKKFAIKARNLGKKQKNVFIILDQRKKKEIVINYVRFFMNLNFIELSYEYNFVIKYDLKKKKTIGKSNSSFYQDLFQF